MFETTAKEAPPKKFILSADIGQMADYTALGVLDVTSGEVYKLVYLTRLKLRTPYPEVVKIIKKTFDDLVIKAGAGGEVVLVLDCTGVGRPLVDMLKAAGLSPMAVTITGGDVATHEGREYHVPKRDLVAACQLLMQQGRLKVAEGVKAAEEFVRELESFKYKINISTGHDSYEAWRESIHDDLVLTVCMACWAPDRVLRPSIRRLW
jgi:hypothetical protein